jgi:hydroxymethylglutaryl-CoA lyase/(R)-citramalyl-CoA lyase
MTASPALCDVGPRDGLQNEAVTLAPLVRAELCERLVRAGLRAVEVGSFVSPRAVPQMAGTELVFAALRRDPGVTYSALVLNARGLERAVAAGADEIHIAYPLSDTFSLRNQNMMLEQAASAAAEMIGEAHARGVPATVTLGAAFGCPFEGRIDAGVVVDHVRRMAAAGADAIMLADSIGVAAPAAVRRLVPAALEAAGACPIGLHLHNTRNTGYANADAGLGAGATILDASIGGLGGCPFAPAATGNIATEDLVYMLEEGGIDTGVDLDELIGVSEWLASVMQARLPGLVHRAGRFVPVGVG